MHVSTCTCVHVAKLSYVIDHWIPNLQYIFQIIKRTIVHGPINLCLSPIKTLTLNNTNFNQKRRAPTGGVARYQSQIRGRMPASLLIYLYGTPGSMRRRVPTHTPTTCIYIHTEPADKPLEQ